MSLQQSIIGSNATPFVVGVTGGGLYNSGFDYNSAAVLKDALPDSFHREGKPTIKILKATENLPAEYYPSRKLIQGLWAGNLSMYDPTEEPNDGLQVRLMIHMGMRTKEPNYCFETFARRDGYIHPDNLGKLPSPEDYDTGGYFDGCPEELRPNVDVEAAGKAAQELLPDHKMRVSSNAGHNLCEWFFYTSLAEGYKRGAPRNVAFIHVPPGRREEDLKTGVEVLKAYIGALVSQIEAKSEA
ncbi:hypothetical protein CDV36_003771 [Fusarium kuroshium]|uniref:Peptidase C15, pyroglutamyl peptidase I-like protein n=1 Tax=Fusarium kuroshium TaxID=2010991 RepID=A0A3M2SGD5_9HYPO|nr:hypothetical protein CDV36_003771 [Fusarium kuroshium]